MDAHSFLAATQIDTILYGIMTGDSGHIFGASAALSRLLAVWNDPEHRQCPLHRVSDPDLRLSCPLLVVMK